MASKGKRPRVAEASSVKDVSASDAITAQWKALTEIPVINVADVTPKTFYERFVAKRIPVIINGVEGTSEFSKATWELQAMLNICGESTVHIESRDDKTKTFGTGVKRPRKFKKFISAMQKGADDIYLTTQPITDDEETGLPVSAHASPVTEMIAAKAMPLKPKLAGNLVPANVNIWMGRSKDGTSSNLHHDFHDNIYLVLQGRKRFTLAAPCFAHNMYLHGKVTYIHPNGLINYAGFATRDDGALPHILYEKALAEKAGAKKLFDLHKILVTAASRDAEYAKMCEDVLGTASAAADSEDVSDKEIGPAAGASESESDAADVDAMWAALTKTAAGSGAKSAPKPTTAAKMAEIPAKGKSKASKGDEVEDMWAMLMKEGSAAAPKVKKDADIFEGVSTETKKTSAIPDHFSRIPLPNLRDELRKDKVEMQTGKRKRATNAFSMLSTVQHKYPLFADVPLLEVELAPWQMLYLPASWFHEVVSFSHPADAAEHAVHTHIAVNYWFHPASTSGNYDSPYGDDFWADAVKVLGK